MAYGQGTSSALNTSTGVNDIDGLLQNRRWTSSTVTFSFTSNFQNDYEEESGYPDSATHQASFSTLNGTQRTVARRWMTQYENVSGLNLVELFGSNDRNATIRMAESSDPGTAYAYGPGSNVRAGDIWFNRTDFNNPVMGSYSYRAFGHEIGHALGLKHAHEEGGVSDVAVDANRSSMEFSLMNYRSYIGHPGSGGYTNETWGHAQSLMMLDIRAIQQMYGANFNYNSANTRYTFNTSTGEMSINGVGQGVPGGNRIFRTIWDGNGTDTYDFANYSTDLQVSLAPGGWSDLDVAGDFQRSRLGPGEYARGHVFNALQYGADTRSLIENAYGGSGDDLIFGNNAHNYLRGNAGDDSLYGLNGNDTLSGGVGDDVVSGGNGADRLYGSSNNDRLYGGDGQDQLYGGSGDDWVNGGLGTDTMDGGSGRDTLDVRFWDGDYELNMNTGITNFAGERATNFEIVYTGSGNDTITGTLGDDVIRTGAGNDWVNGFAGQDRMDGGAGSDTLDVRFWNGAYELNMNTGVTNFANETARNFENILTGAGDDRVVGTSGANVINTGAGDDWVDGQAGLDFMNGGSGIDTLDVTFWNGTYDLNMVTGVTNFAGETALNFENVCTGSGNNRITGNIANNIIHTGAGNDWVDGGAGNDEMDGGAGVDTLDVTFWNGVYELDMNTGVTNFAGETAINFENVFTGAGNDRIIGTSGANTINTGAGNDWVDGGAGSDTMNAGAGVDTLDVRFWNGAYELDMNTGVTNFAGETALNFENILTGSGNDRVIGTSGVNVINTGAGDDYVDGRAGLDFMNGGAGIDTLDVRFWNSGYNLNMETGVTNYPGETALNFEIIYTGSGNDEIIGGATANTIRTGSGDDVLLGGDGNDLLVGQQGEDTLTGGTGSDMFRFESLGDRRDEITDFSQADGDVIQVLGRGFGGLVSGVLDASQFVLGSIAQDANDRFLYDQSTGVLSYDADGSGFRSAVQMATLSNRTALSSHDIFVI